MKKFLATMIAAMFVLAMVPTVALAAETTAKDETDLAGSMSPGQNYDVIKLAEDIVLTTSVRVPAGKTITVDLNGHKLTGPDD